MTERQESGWFTEDGRPTHAVTDTHKMSDHRRVKREMAELRNGGSSFLRDGGKITREQYLRSRDGDN